MKNIINKLENMMADYVEHFGEYIPISYLFYDMQSIIDYIEQAFINNQKLK